MAARVLINFEKNVIVFQTSWSRTVKSNFGSTAVYADQQIADPSRDIDRERGKKHDYSSLKSLVLANQENKMKIKQSKQKNYNTNLTCGSTFFAALTAHLATCDHSEKLRLEDWINLLLSGCNKKRKSESYIHEMNRTPTELYTSVDSLSRTRIHVHLLDSTRKSSVDSVNLTNAHMHMRMLESSVDSVNLTNAHMYMRMLESSDDSISQTHTCTCWKAQLTQSHKRTHAHVRAGKLRWLNLTNAHKHMRMLESSVDSISQTHTCSCTCACWKAQMTQSHKHTHAHVYMCVLESSVESVSHTHTHVHLDSLHKNSAVSLSHIHAR